MLLYASASSSSHWWYHPTFHPWSQPHVWSALSKLANTRFKIASNHLQGKDRYLVQHDSSVMLLFLVFNSKLGSVVSVAPSISVSHLADRTSQSTDTLLYKSTRCLIRTSHLDLCTFYSTWKNAYECPKVFRTAKEEHASESVFLWLPSSTASHLSTQFAEASEAFVSSKGSVRLHLTNEATV